MNLLKSEQAKEIVENVKTINFLIKTSEDIEKVHLASMIEFGKTHFNTMFTKKVNLQHMVGSTSIEDFKKIIEQSLNSRLMITLLGSVEGHEDNAFYAGNYKEWLNELKMLNIKFIKQGLFPKISIDDLLEMNYKEDFAELGINKKNDYNIESTKLLIDGIGEKIILNFNGIINEEIKLNKDWLINYNKITKSGNKNGNKIKYK